LQDVKVQGADENDMEDRDPGYSVMAHEAADSCVTQHKISDDNYTPNFTCLAVEVKQEDLRDVKVEVADRDSSITAHEAGDSCVTQLKSANDKCTPDFATFPLVEVKQENLQDVKVEVVDENDMELMEDPNFSLKVSIIMFIFLCFRDYAMCLIGYLKIKETRSSSIA